MPKYSNETGLILSWLLKTIGKKQPTNMKHVCVPPRLQMGGSWHEYQTKSTFQITWSTFKTNFTATKSQKYYHGSPFPSVRVWWRPFSQFRALMVSVEGAQHRAQAGRDALRAVHLSQPIIWALLWTTAVNNFFKIQKVFFFMPSLQNQPPSPCNYFNTWRKQRDGIQ